MMVERERWIDMLRGFCMLAILLDHTEIYYTGGNLIPYDWYVSNVLIVFFFLSGYLMYKQQGFSLRHKLTSIGRSLLLPYFLFTIVLALPKAFVHGHSIDWESLLLPILTGRASWFIAALIVSEVVFSLFLWITRGKVIPLFILSSCAFVGSVLLTKQSTAYPWCINNALQAVLFLYIGWFYQCRKDVFNHINTPLFTSFLFIFLIVIKGYATCKGVHTMIYPMGIDSYFIFFLDMLTSIFLLVNVCKQLPRCKPLEWVGAHSIVYYFVCGGVPLCLSLALEKVDLGYHGAYYSVLIAYALVCIVASCIVAIVYRYLPFMLGKLH
ncbi:acyltransferase family protein [Prevotella sp. oral taxon 306]|uniref:acyltransferase family protein n=1 Tax=Prevotella sp. oral taxon 306 TaxID=712461 RepID=UPI000318F845|nr:acyltransferase family protein [Prevotella sp. oral taxon 306]